MSFTQELTSWFAPKPTHEVASPPTLGSQAPKTPKLQLESGKPTILSFLRHCGCPFAEKTFLNLREAATANRHINFLAISHSDEASTETWLKSLPQAGSEPSNLKVVVDSDSEAYAAWGLGVSGYAHVLSPSALWSVWTLAKEEGIANRPTESGSRWQTAGSWGVDAEGKVRWGGPAARADEIPDFEEAVGRVGGEEAKGEDGA